MLTIVRRFLLWCVVAGVSATPSFFLAASDGYDVGAMLCGIAAFVCLLTAITCTPWFNRLSRQPFVRQSLYIGYGARIAFSLVFPITWIGDAVLGMKSIQLAEHLGVSGKDFAGTLFTTLVHGTVINTLIFIFMGIVYTFQRLCLPLPPEPGPLRAFEVVPVSSDPRKPRPVHPLPAEAHPPK